MIIGNVSGGMQDQMRFENEKGEWIDFNNEFCSNHFGTYKKCGDWVMPVFPSNMSIVGSIPTPYIFDDRVDFRDVANAIQKVYELSPEERQTKGMHGRDWVQSNESGMSARKMSEKFIDTIDKTLNNFNKRDTFELVKIEKLPRKKLVHPLTY
jgi:hypothetical protein